MSELLEQALKYAKRNWYVFPTREVPSEPFWDDKVEETVVRPVKSPYISGGFKNSSVDPKVIIEWWTRYPNAGIGIDCGKSNLVVLDLDVRGGKDGFSSFLKLEISDEGALHSITPSGGMHIIFRGQSHSHADVINGMDVRSKGAYIIAPPSWILEDGDRLYYKAVDNWNREPVEAPFNLDEKVDTLRGHTSKNIKKNTNRVYKKQDPDKLYERVREALYKLPPMFYIDYFKWVNVGLALKSEFGDKGFELWDEWSKQGGEKKYKPQIMRPKWETFEPTAIGVGSIFYEAKRYSK